MHPGAKKCLRDRPNNYDGSVPLCFVVYDLCQSKIV